MENNGTFTTGKGLEPAPPDRLIKLMTAMTPPTGGIVPRSFIAETLWRKFPSMAKFLPRVPLALAPPILWHAREAFYWQMGLAQGCILILPFADVLTRSLIVVLGLVFAFLVVREGYITSDWRTDAEVITAFMTPALILGFAVLLGLAFPGGVPPLSTILPRALEGALPMALCRFWFAKEPGPEHPCKGLLRLYNRTWLGNWVWAAGAIAVLGSNFQAVPGKLVALVGLPTNLLSAATIVAFGVAYRLPQNPIAGISRHRRIHVTLNKDPYLSEILAKRDILLTGADWIRGFGKQAFFEMLSFILLALPLAIGLWKWYSGDPAAAGINWLQMYTNGFAWVALVIAWTGVKRSNRRTQAAFDLELQKIRG